MSVTWKHLVCGLVVVASAAITATSLALFLLREDPPQADADGYLRIACGLHAETSGTPPEEDHPLGADIGLKLDLFLLVAEEDPGLARFGEAAEEAADAMSSLDDDRLARSQDRIGEECSDVSGFEPDPDTYVDVACGLVQQVVDDGPESQRHIDVATELVRHAAEHDPDHENLERAASKVREFDERSDQATTELLLRDFLDECRA